MSSSNQDGHQALSVDNLNDEKTLQSIKLLKTIISSCYGPNGRCKITHNAVGGHVTITSSSTRLLNTVTITHPILLLVTSAAKGHIAKYSDGGLYVNLLALCLLENALKNDVNFMLVGDLIEEFTKMLTDYLISADCPTKSKLDFNNIKNIIDFVKSVIGSKKMCFANDLELSHVSRLVVEAFLKSVSGDGAEQPYCLVAQQGVEGLPVRESYLEHGILYPVGYVETPRIADVKSSGDCIKVALIAVSMSGDSDEVVNARWEFSSATCWENLEPNLDGTVLTRLREICDSWISNNVGVVLCQKVVHPQLKEYLYSKGIVVIDRIGLNSMKSLSELTGGKPLKTLHPCHSDTSYYGNLSEITVKTIGRKQYYLFRSQDSCVNTLVLGNWSEEPLEELKHVCSVALHCLQMALMSPEVVQGSGVVEKHLSQYIRHQVEGHKDLLLKKFSCTSSQLLAGVDIYTKSLGYISSLVPEEGEYVKDLLANKLNALRIGSYTAATVLRTGTMISNV